MRSIRRTRFGTRRIKAMTTETTTKAERSNRAVRRVLVGSPARRTPAGFVACRAADVERCVETADANTVFVSDRRSSTDRLLRAGAKRRGGRLGKLIVLEPPRPASVPSLVGLFDRVVGAAEGFRWLPRAELFEAMSQEDAADRFIGGAVDPRGETVALVRGDLATIVAPFGCFTPAGDGVVPDFERLSFADYGVTVALGEYEASADAILYEFDSEYRRRLNRRRREEEQGFGPAFRRLRLQRKLKRSDFDGVSEKTIARIERGEIAKPRGRTLETIAERLGVDADQIETY
jgi:Helix-turn-helix